MYTNKIKVKLNVSCAAVVVGALKVNNTILTDLGKMSLQFIPSVRAVLHSLGECYIGSVPLLPHLVSTRIQHSLYLISHVLGRCTLALGSLDVVVTKLSPSFWYGNPVHKEKFSFALDFR